MDDVDAILTDIGLGEHVPEINWGESGFFLYCSCGTYTDYYPKVTPLQKLNEDFNVHKSRVDKQ